MGARRAHRYLSRNQLAFVTAKIALEYWSDSTFTALVRKNSELMEQAIAHIADREGVVAGRGRGLIAGIHFGLGNVRYPVSAGRMDHTMSKQRKRHTPEQIIRKLGQADRLLGEGNTVADVCREFGVTEQTYYR